MLRHAPVEGILQERATDVGTAAFVTKNIAERRHGLMKACTIVPAYVHARTKNEHQPFLRST